MEIARASRTPQKMSAAAVPVTHWVERRIQAEAAGAEEGARVGGGMPVRPSDFSAVCSVRARDYL